MTISSTINRTSDAGNDVTTAFSFPYLFLADGDLTVILQASDGTETIQTITTHYTVTGAGVQAGGTVTMVTAPATGETLVILRDADQTQLVDLVENDPLPAETLEDALDRLTMLVQRLSDRLDRSLVLQDTDPTATLTIPELSTRLSKFLAFDAAGDVIAATTITTSTVSSFAATYLDDTTAAATRTTLDAAQKITSSTADTPEIADELGFADISDSNAENKAIVGAVAAAALSAGWLANVGFAAATTAETSDSIKIQGAAATLSATNPLYVNLPSTTAGLIVRFNIVADITMDLTGAHWAYGTLGDLTDALLTVYAINDTAAIKFGVSRNGQLTSILNTDSSATGTDITAADDMLVNTTLNAGTWPCQVIGHIKANFDDTGGASEDLWVVQTGVGDLIPSQLIAKQDHSSSVADTGNGHGSGSTKIRRFSNETGPGGAITYAESASLGSTWTINKSGMYAMGYSDSDASAEEEIGISLNSTQLTTAIESITTADRIAFTQNGGVGVFGFCSSVAKLMVGDVIRAHTSGNPDSGSARAMFRIYRVGD